MHGNGFKDKTWPDLFGGKSFDDWWNETVTATFTTQDGRNYSIQTTRKQADTAKPEAKKLGGTITVKDFSK